MVILRFLIMIWVVAIPGLVLAGDLEMAMERLAKDLERTISATIKPLSVAVLRFEGVDENLGKIRADQLAGALGGYPDVFRVVDRNSERMQDAEREFITSRSDYFDQQTAARVGKMIGAKAFVYARSERDSQRERLSAWVYFIETGERLPVVYAEYRYTQSASSGAFRSLILPGWGQWSLGHKGSGAFFLLASVGLGAGTFYANNQASNARDNAFLVGSVAERDRLLADERSWKDKRNLFLAGLGGIWAINILHAAWISAHTPVYAEFDGKTAQVGLTIGF